MAGLQERQRRWALHFAETGNASEAARRAGYAQKRAEQAGCRNLNNPKVMAEVQKQLKKIESEVIANAEEVMIYLTNVLRGGEKEEVVVVESIGDFTSKARKIKKELQPKDRLKAAELLAKRYGLLTENLVLTEAPKVVDDI